MNSIFNNDVHCEYCQTPSGSWAPDKNITEWFKGDQCELYDTFLEVIHENEGRTLTLPEFVSISDKHLQDYMPDISKLSELVRVLIEIQLDLGLLEGAIGGKMKVLV